MPVGIDEEGFSEVSRSEGKLKLEFEGKAEEKDFRSRNFLNRAGTIGYAVVEVDGRPDHIFISNTAQGMVITMPGEQTGPSPLPIEGYAAISTVKAESPVGDYYAAHREALAGKDPLANDEWFREGLPGLPQRALDVSMKMFTLICEQMDQMMSSLGSAVGDVVEGLGKAMGESMEGFGQSLSEAVDSTREEIPAPTEKATLAPAEMRPSRKKPAKKRPAVRAPVKRKAARKASARKKPARKAKAPAGKVKRKVPARKRR
jgi:hypothetical protein